MIYFVLFEGFSLWVQISLNSDKSNKHTLLKQTIEKSICKDCGGGKILIRLKIQS